MKSKKYQFSKDELIDGVKNNSEIGNKIIEIEKEFLKAMKKKVMSK